MLHSILFSLIACLGFGVYDYIQAKKANKPFTLNNQGWIKYALGLALGGIFYSWIETLSFFQWLQSVGVTVAIIIFSNVLISWGKSAWAWVSSKFSKK